MFGKRSSPQQNLNVMGVERWEPARSGRSSSRPVKFFILDNLEDGAKGARVAPIPGIQT